MSWRDDRYWAAAFKAALEAADDAELVLVPSEFLGEHPRFVPLEYSWGLRHEGRRIAWCCSKDDAHRLAPWVHEEHAERRHCRWANEVFVLCGRFGWSQKASWLSVRHWQVWRERVGDYLAGRGDPEHEFRAAPGARHGKGPRVLVVGASGMGNIGDDLLAYVLADLLRRHANARVWWSDSDVAPGHLKRFDAVVVGGGGLIYASRDGRNETQNLANYLKFGPMCRLAGVPVAMIGVSDQDHAGGLDRDDATREFARACVPLFHRSTTRDASSTELLQGLGLAEVHTGPDLLFAWALRARRATRPSLHQPARLAMAGELLDNVHVVAGLNDPGSALVRVLAGQQVDLLLMSNDDVSHAKRLSPLLLKLGCTASIQDFRGAPFENLVHGFSQYRGLITTRFHGLVLAILCDVPVLALDGPEGKKTRLLRTVSDGDCKLLTTDVDVTQGVTRLAQAVAGDLHVVGRPRADTFSARVSVHVAALRELLAPWGGGDSDQQEQDQGLDVEPLPPMPDAGERYRVGGLVRNASDKGGSVALCWAASTKDTQGYGNLGDSLSAVMVSALSGRRVHHVGFDRPETKLVAVGSIAHAIRNGEAVIWGSGVSIRGGVLAGSVPRTHYDVRAIRGPISARHLRDFGIAVPEVYGDPVWLLPSIFDEPVEKRYELGVIPHIQDVQGFGPDARPPADSLRFHIDPSDAGSVLLINTWHEPTWDGIRKTLRAILSCKRIVSQSFHGVVIAEAYGIPVLNYRQMVNVPNGPLTISLEEDCTTDPRIWEFYRGGPRNAFEMYSQRREERSDWEAVIRAIDQRWEPFRYDASALVESFPLPLAYDPLVSRIPDAGRLKGMRF
ncbi:polysaccharide pyruvyl transferase family protein [Ideonella sp. YS5]|uniref:polysaccharide pyruvyl transferase family protein n=1 Tax=Ideonella sp. YS5 TaxID=3453714 RepID=UPI003EEFB061